MNHDIIDNRNEKLVDHILQILPASERAKFAVGYFFLSGFEALANRLDCLKELRLLIGSTSNRQTVEQLAEAYRRLELVQDRQEATRFAKRSELSARTVHTQYNLRESIEVMDQTDEAEQLVHGLARMVQEGRLQVRVYTKGRLHAKAYIFDYANPNPGNAGIAVVGSSNLTLSGIRDNTELNVLVHDNASPMHPQDGNHGKLTAWFEELWEESQDFAPALMNELQQSWAGTLATPYDIYMKTLYTLVKDRLEDEAEPTILYDDEITHALANFQKEAVRRAVGIIRQYGGCFVSDVVGLGKSFVGAAIIKFFERTEHARPLIICPKPLEDMWIRYNETYQLHANIIPMSQLQADDGRGINLMSDPRTKDRDFILIDESHNFRNHTSQRYEVLQDYTSVPWRRVCLLTATPLNSRAKDVYNQIKLFHPEDRTDVPIDPSDLKQYIKDVDEGKRSLHPLLLHLMVRRRRRDVLRWHGYTGDTNVHMRTLTDAEAVPYLTGPKRAYVIVAGKHEYFPERKLETMRYSIEKTYSGLYEQLRSAIGKADRDGTYRPTPGQNLTYARYGLWNYVKKEKRKEAPYKELGRAGINLRGIVRTSLFKRFESSVEAFRLSLQRMQKTQAAFLGSLQKGFVPAGIEAERLLLRAIDKDDILSLIEKLGTVSDKYNLADFDADKLKSDLLADMELIGSMLKLVQPITPAKDAKLQEFFARLTKAPIKGGKCLVFTQYADTAQYIYDNLNSPVKREDVEVIYGTDKSKSRAVWRFAPKANPDLKPPDNPPPVNILVATDVLAEGFNLQDGNVVLNYDLHWNPVRLIQRLGRVDRIGSDHRIIYGLNFLPELGIERELGIQAILSQRISEIHEAIGEDAAILDPSEAVNETAMYAIYTQQTGLDTLEEQANPLEQDFLDVNEAEELFRTMQTDEPEEYERIQNLRDGIRSINRETTEEGIYVMCKAGTYTQLYLADPQGNIISKDLPRVLKTIRVKDDGVGMARGTVSGRLPDGYNRALSAVKAQFSTEVLHRETQRDYTIRAGVAQRYVLRELRALYDSPPGDTDEMREELLREIAELEQAFRGEPTAAVKRELNFLRKNSVTGYKLIRHLKEIYLQHRLEDRLQTGSTTIVNSVPRIICSELLQR